MAAFGLLNINKPVGPTSHDIVDAVRRGTGERKVGHGGTLDPLAGGVLVLALGPATRLLEYLSASEKEYLAVVKLGLVTDTGDAEGEVIEEHTIPPDLHRGGVEAILARFLGPIEQTPPPYSAVKVKGKAAYYRARAGEALQLPPRQVVIKELTLLDFAPPTLTLRVRCSAGTYIRSLARDIGTALGCGAMLSALTRTASGAFRLEEAVGWEALQAAFADGSWPRYLLLPDLALEGTPRIALDNEALGHVIHGRPLPAAEVSAGIARAYAPDGRFVAVLEGDVARGAWLPRKVFLQDYT